MPIRASEDCDYRVAAAIEEVRARWKPYTARSRRYSIFKLLKETVDPAWKNYTKSLLVEDARRAYGKKFVFSKLAKRGGFRHVDDALCDLVRRVALARSSSIGNGAPRSRGRLVYPESMF